MLMLDDSTRVVDLMTLNTVRQAWQIALQKLQHIMTARVKHVGWQIALQKFQHIMTARVKHVGFVFKDQ